MLAHFHLISTNSFPICMFVFHVCRGTPGGTLNKQNQMVHVELVDHQCLLTPVNDILVEPFSPAWSATNDEVATNRVNKLPALHVFAVGFLL